MKASLFCTARYLGAAPHDIWPLSGEYYSPDAVVRSMQTIFDKFRQADEFGFDWGDVRGAQLFGLFAHPEPDGLAGALSQIARRAKIAVLGPTLPILNPVRVAEELAMIVGPETEDRRRAAGCWHAPA
jgi:alkanesulfonate monooxygenase SsuD/methylene tetrahydromethanopterin reductase-like flavin-dependent oxidoreductase (luciferase family)